MADGTGEKGKNVAVNSSTSDHAIQLEPFIHQVGGHSSMLRLDEQTVCKPLIQRELKFYKALPDEIKTFTPQYKGIIEVNFVEDSDGYITIIAHPPRNNLEGFKLMMDDVDLEANSHRLRLRRSGSIEIESPSEDESSLFEEISTVQSDDEESSCNDKSSGQTMNPWVLKCHREQLRKLMKGTSSGVKSQKFILLENLTWRYQFPCILDLKMGTRQYGDDASPAKVQSQTAKVEASTSSKLGIRICGMQVYQVKTGNYICRNKYHGRRLTVDGFKDTLLQFLHNGHHLRIDIVKPVIDRLRQLHSVLEKQDSFRFYTSSLLIIYDGSNRSNCTVDKNCKDTTSQSAANSKGELGNTDVGNGNFIKKDQMNFDIRMIDFAHSTRKGFDDDTIHHGPDRGYMFGLENLISFFEEILKEFG